MSRADKSPRKQAAREQRLAEMQAAQRRQRMVALGTILAIVAVVVGFALFSGGDEEGGETAAGGCWPDSARGPGKSYSQPPQMVLDDGVDYAATVETSEGSFEMDLLEEETPLTVNNFVCLARDNFYDGLIWHRVEMDLVIQGGDPQGTGQGGPGYAIEDELPQGPDVYTFGAVGMANSGPNSAGSQFFVVVTDPDPKGGSDPAGFPPSYAVFGRVDPEDARSKKTILAIANVEVGGGGGPEGTMPVQQVTIDSVEIEES